MSSILPLGIIGLVVAFIASLLSGFPLDSIAADTPVQLSEAENVTELDVEAVEAAGDRIASVYCLLIEDIASFQSNPSVEKANTRRDAFVAYSNSLVGKYRDFSSQLQSKLDELTMNQSGESS